MDRLRLGDDASYEDIFNQEVDAGLTQQEEERLLEAEEVFASLLQEE